MATSNIPTTPGSGKNIATYSFTEDTITKDIQRTVVSTSSGVELGSAATPVQVSLANTAANSTAIKVDGSAVTQPVSGTFYQATQPVSVAATLAVTNIPVGATPIVGVTAAITDTTSTSVIASGGGSVKNYITSILVTNSHATVGTFVKILDGSTIIWEGYAAAAGGGFASSFTIPLVGTAATAVNCQPVTTGANVICSITGYKI